jgi:hypothetical protein
MGLVRVMGMDICQVSHRIEENVQNPRVLCIASCSPDNPKSTEAPHAIQDLSGSTNTKNQGSSYEVVIT